MKTLQESLFDNNLASKDLHMKDVYTLHDINISMSSVNVRCLFDDDKLRRYPDQTDYFKWIENPGLRVQVLCRILMNQPIIKRNEAKKWASNFKDELSKYLKSGNKTTWQHLAGIYLYYNNDKKLEVDIGDLTFILELK